MITKLGDVLLYEQPTKYIVESTEYSDKYKTPVLTAGQSFILGYTNETNNIYTDVPVIIFDDFTTSVQYVDFPFKVKSSAMKILTTKNANLKYLYYLLATIRVDTNLHKRYWISTFADMIVDLPSLEEQNDIVNKLDKLESIVSNKEQQLSKLDELVKSRFVELFGTPLLNEKGWVVKSAGDVCSVTDGSHFSPVGKEDGYPMLSVRNMRNDGFHYDDCKLVSQEDYDILVKQGCKPLKNDVLIAKDGSYFYYGFVVKEEIEQAVLSSIAILRPNLEQVNPEYLCRYMLSSEIVDLVGKNYVTGAAIKRVILKGIKQIPVMLPPIELQNQFATFVEQTDKSKLAIQQSLEQLETLKKSLMQQYFG